MTERLSLTRCDMYLKGFAASWSFDWTLKLGLNLSQWRGKGERMVYRSKYPLSREKWLLYFSGIIFTSCQSSLPGESQGQGSLVGCRLWGRTELDTTKET